MTLIEELAENTTRGPGCRVGLIRRDDPGLYDEIVEAVDAGYGYVAISTALRNRGMDVSNQMLSRHFRRICSCRS